MARSRRPNTADISHKIERKANRITRPARGDWEMEVTFPSAVQTVSDRMISDADNNTQREIIRSCAETLIKKWEERNAESKGFNNAACSTEPNSSELTATKSQGTLFETEVHSGGAYYENGL